MSDMRNLLESMYKFAGEKVGQKPGDQVRGSEPMPKKGGYKKHPYAGRLVGGGAEESVEEDLEESLRQQFAEYGAPGSAIGNDTATNPAEVFAKGQQEKANKDQIKGQISGLVAQMQGARAQLADMNKAFPQGANPVEKAMSLQQMSAQKVGIQRQIEDLASQIAALRQQAI
jgi:hypothetical protein